MVCNRKVGEFMKNLLVRQSLLAAGVKNYELAEMLGISEWTLSRKLRKELPQAEQEKIIKLIQSRRSVC